jgi:hypothetical protein
LNTLTNDLNENQPQYRPHSKQIPCPGINFLIFMGRGLFGKFTYFLGLTPSKIDGVDRVNEGHAAGLLASFGGDKDPDFFYQLHLA